MLYNSLTFLAFFVLVFAGYWLLRGNRARLGLLLAASLAFYAAWYPRYLLLFLIVTAVTYGAGVLVGAWRVQRPVAARHVVQAVIIVDLAMLAVFKYASFLLGTAAAVAHGVAGSGWHPPLVHLVLPLGISFYSFQSIAYVVDVYRGDVAPVTNPLKLALFKAFFPQLIAGPIVRADELVPQFESSRRASAAQMQHGLDLIAFGLFKKVLVADQVAPFADQIFARPGAYGALPLLLGIYAYAVQIYCDFSGYTDIGRGCAELLGYTLPRNFDAPYFSVNIVDFWRRWHMTLSRWLRDYLYIPLGGSRRGPYRTYVNLVLTMTLGGLWHGANWTFVIWGLYHGMLLAGTRWIHDRAGVKGEDPLFRPFWYRVLATVVTFHLVCVGWVFFRARTVGDAIAVLQGVVTHPFIARTDLTTLGAVSLAVTGVSVCLLAVLHLAATNWPRWSARLPERSTPLLRGALLAGVAIGVTLFANRGAAQFIYFQF